MSQVMSPPALSDQERLEKLCTAIRGKMQFMDYLVRAAIADVDRYRDETDPGTRIFIRQLVEMHVTNLSAESDHMTSVGEFCRAIDSVLGQAPHGDDE